MPYRELRYESTSAANLFATADRLVGGGWQACEFETRQEGYWPWRRTIYSITFRFRLPPSQPGPVSLRVTAEDSEMLQFVIQLPAKTEAEFDVVSRLVELTVGGVALEAQTVPVDATEVGPFSGKQGDAVTGKCWNIDDAGNKSAAASEFSGVLVDTFAPPPPGMLGIKVVGETADPVVPTPEPEPVPVPEPTPEPVEDETA